MIFSFSRPRLVAGLILSSSVLLAACGALEPLHKTKETVQKDEVEISQHLSKMQNINQDTIAAGQVREHVGRYGGGRALPMLHGDPLPYSHFTLNTKGQFITLRDVATEITAQARIPVDVFDDVPSQAATGQGQGQAQSPLQGGRQEVNPHPIGGKCVIAPNFDGDLEKYLDVLQTWCDLSWSYDRRENHLSVRQYEQRKYTLLAEPTEAIIKSSVSGTGGTGTTDSGSGGTSGGSSQAQTGQTLSNDTTHDGKLKVWEEMKNVLESMAGQGVVKTSPSTRTIVVIAKPSAQRNIEELLRDINRKLLQEVVFSVTIIDLTTSNQTDLGLTLSGVITGSKGTISPSTPPQIPVDNVGSLAFTSTGGALAGSKILLDMLNEIGNVTSHNTYTLRTLNTKPLPVVVARQKAYVSNASTSALNTTSSTSSASLSTLTIGLTMQLVPVILDDGQLILQYSFGLSSLNELTQFDTGSLTLQEPDINVRGASQEALLSSGESVVLLGFDQATANQTDRGLPGLADGMLGFIGGSKYATNSHAAMVVVVTPQIKANHVTGL